MTKPFIDPRRLQFQSRAGDGRVKQHGDGNLPVPLPPRNEPCPCGSGKKAKRCHPDGLQPRVNRVIALGKCDGPCGKDGIPVIPLRHDGLPGWVRYVCPPCAAKPETFKALLASAPSPSPAKLNSDEVALQTNDSERTGTVIVYRCEKCGETDLVDVADSTIAAGTYPPRSTPCAPCGVPRMPVAARRATSKEFGDLFAAGLAKDEAEVKRFLGDEQALGILPGVQVKTIPFAGDVVMGPPA